jgi:hypothetical protein
VVFAGMLAGLVAACSSAPSRPPAPPPKLEPIAACLQVLDQHSVVYERLKDWRTPEGCGVDGAVRISRSAISWNRPATMGCQLAARLWGFETTVLQPAARRTLGRTVRKLSHAGAYDCRGERGGRPERLSEHALGRAIDITGFELDDGSVVSVLKDWRGSGAKSEFLHQVAAGACQVFSVVITPNHNALHSDHLHMDIGPYKLCGM